jgi:hypothetical protein
VVGSDRLLRQTGEVGQRALCLGSGLVVESAKSSTSMKGMVKAGPKYSPILHGLWALAFGWCQRTLVLVLDPLIRVGWLVESRESVKGKANGNAWSIASRLTKHPRSHCAGTLYLPLQVRQQSTLLPPTISQYEVVPAFPPRLSPLVLPKFVRIPTVDCGQPCATVE